MNPKSRSLNAKFPGELFFPINLSDFQTKFSVFLAKSRNPAQKRKFLFSGRAKFCRKEADKEGSRGGEERKRGRQKEGETTEEKEDDLQNFTRPEKGISFLGLDAWN